MMKKFCLLFLSLYCLMATAYGNQVYTMADNSDSNTSNGSTAPSMPNIYINPAPKINSNPTQKSASQAAQNTPSPIPASTSASNNSAPVNNTTVNSAAPSAPSPSTSSNVAANSSSTATSTPSSSTNSNALAINNAPPTHYTDAMRAKWMQSCMTGASSAPNAQNAQFMCECAWNKIAAGGIPIALFTSENPQDLQQLSSDLKVIGQQCSVEAQSSH